MKELEKTNSLVTDRFELKDQVELNLLKFIDSQIEKVNNENSLKRDVLFELSQRVNNCEDPINDLVLLKLLEILSKTDNDIALGIMDLMKTNNKGNSGIGEDHKPSEEEQSKESDLTKEDVADVKDLLKTLEKVKKSEF